MLHGRENAMEPKRWGCPRIFWGRSLTSPGISVCHRRLVTFGLGKKPRMARIVILVQAGSNRVMETHGHQIGSAAVIILVVGGGGVGG